MKKIIAILIINLVIYPSLFSQVKMWDKEYKGIKTKGIISTLDTLKTEPIVKDDQKSLIGSATIVGSLLPYVIKYGNYAVKKNTNKDEKKYKSELKTLNNVIFETDTLEDKYVYIRASQFYYKKNIKDTVAYYDFKLHRDGALLSVKYVNEKENFSTVKLKKKYDLIITSFNINVQARIYEEIDDGRFKFKLLDLGTTTIYKVNPSFMRYGKEILNQGSYVIPNLTEKGKMIIVKDFVFSIEMSHVNPYGFTTSWLNDFFENNSDTNEEFLNALLIKKDDD